MTTTELQRDAGTLTGAGLILTGLWLIWVPLAFLLAGGVLWFAFAPKVGAR